MMGVLRISLFGGVRVAHASGSSEVKATRTVQTLLAYLLLYRHRVHPREVLAGLFWGDHGEEGARGCLSTTLWRLRGVLEPDGIPRGTYLLATPTGEVGFNCASDHWLDVAVFEEKAGQVLAKPIPAVDATCIRELESALQLYTADLLEGFYDDWALRERERLRMLYLTSLSHLMHYYKYQGGYEEGLTYGQQILRHDPLREEIHREMMRLYLDSGQRALAVRQYETCCDILATELGVPPMEETQALYMQIVPDADYHRPADAGRGEPAGLQQAVRQLHYAMQSFTAAHEQLQRAIQLVERLGEH